MPQQSSPVCPSVRGLRAVLGIGVVSAAALGAVARALLAQVSATSTRDELSTILRVAIKSYTLIARQRQFARPAEVGPASCCEY
jgi:hypothetical protein